MMETLSRQKLVNSVDNLTRRELASQYRAELYPKVLELYDTHTIQEICKVLHVSTWQVTQVFKEYSIPARKRGRHPDGTYYWKPEDKNRKGYGQKNGTTRSRATYEEAYGKVPKGWDVHHIDYDKTNNDLDNLVALPHSKHLSLHGYARHGNKEGVTTILREYLQVKGNTSNPESRVKI